MQRRCAVGCVMLGIFGIIESRRFYVDLWPVARLIKEVHLSLSDVSVDHLPAPSMLYVHLKQSKMDHLWQGVTIVLGKPEQFPL